MEAGEGFLSRETQPVKDAFSREAKVVPDALKREGNAAVDALKKQIPVPGVLGGSPKPQGK